MLSIFANMTMSRCAAASQIYVTSGYTSAYYAGV